MMQTEFQANRDDRTGDATVIRTPDQRVRVFVSSTLDELAPERIAAREAITQLRLTPVFFESGARPYPPRELYQAYLAQSDIFLGLYWQRYGWVAPSMEVSGLEDEYQLSAGKPRLIYVKTPAPHPEPELQRLLDHIRADGVASYQKFATSQELRERIVNDLAQLLTERFAQPLKAANTVHPAPLPVSRGRLIDREQEMALVRELLMREDVGLVTLTGPGGVGKTRVAIQVATELASQFTDGAAFVSLASLNTPEKVAQTVAQALHVSETPGQSIGEHLLRYLHERNLLLVLDNVEQLVAAAPLATQALERAPHLKLLVTSREPLRVRTEHVVPLQPLALPDPRHLPDLESLARVPSVALFLERARAVNPAFALTTDNAVTIVEICRHLDGLPLALELAVSRLSLLGPEALLARLKHHLPLLTQGARDLPKRQQTLHNTLAWSYDLLEEREQHLFRNLSVFAGSFSLDAAKLVCTNENNGEDDAIELVAQLLNKSLIQSTDTLGAEPHFRMLETVRDYALEQLAANGEEEVVRQRHADFYLHVAETAEPHLLSSERDGWLEQLDEAYDNLQSALAWSRENDVLQIGLRLAGALSWYWYLRGNLQEGRTFLEALLAQGGQTGRCVAHGKALYGVSILAWAQGDLLVASARAEESASLFRVQGDAYWLALALMMLGSIQVSQELLDVARSTLEESRVLLQEQDLPSMEAFVVYRLGQVAFIRHDVMEAKTLYQQSQEIFHREEDQLGEAIALSALGIVATAQDDTGAAQSLLAQSISLIRATGDRYDLMQLLITAGTMRVKQGDLQQAQNLFVESLRLWNSVGDQDGAIGVRLSLIGLAKVAMAQGQAERSGRLLGAANSLSLSPGNFFSVTSRVDMDMDIAQNVAQAHTHLDKGAFEVGWSAGQVMTQKQAISYALQST